MSNLTDALIAAKLVGGSGGSGGGSGLPEITPGAQTIIFPQTILSFVDREYYDGETALSLTAGESYTISWDGTDYVCVSTPSEDEISLGNLSLMNPSLPNTGEPFVIDYYYGEGATELMILADNNNASHSIGITQGTPQTPADGSIMQVVNGAWQPVAPPSGGAEVLSFTVQLSLKSDQTISQGSSRTVTLNFLDNNFPDSWNTAAGLSCYIKKDSTIYELVLLKVEFNLPAKNAVATILNPLTHDCTINSIAEMYGYAIKLT